MSRAEVRGIFISASDYTDPAFHTVREFLQHKVLILSTLQELVHLLEQQDDLAEFFTKKSRRRRYTRTRTSVLMMAREKVRYDGELKNINKPSSPTTAVTAAQVANGPVIPPQQRLLTYSPDEWEGFVEEWAYYCLPAKYKHVQRFSGAGDMGIDIAGFADDKRLKCMG